MAYSIHTYAGVNGALKSRLNRESERFHSLEFSVVFTDGLYTKYAHLCWCEWRLEVEIEPRVGDLAHLQDEVGLVRFRHQLNGGGKDTGGGKPTTHSVVRLNQAHAVWDEPREEGRHTDRTWTTS